LSADTDVKVIVADLDAMPEERATMALAECCGSSRWVSAMVARRPFRSRDAVLSAADQVWGSLSPADWLEAFSHHPRIGERKSAVQQSDRGTAWAAGEQSGVEQASEDVRVALASANREYEQRFGYIYIVFATGKSAVEMLAVARGRLRNDPDVEIRIAAEEQRKITRLRLDKLLDKGR
jgi:OHCU decarboxylase